MQDKDQTTPEYEAPEVTDVEDLLGLLGAGQSGPFEHAAVATN